MLSTLADLISPRKPGRILTFEAVKCISLKALITDFTERWFY